MREIILDTETTGLDFKKGHRIIEIGGVELFNRRLTGNHFHCYLNPDREIEAGAIAVHGIKNEFLSDKPRFKEVIEEFIAYIKGAQLIIHNAPFDVGFLDNEFQTVNVSYGTIADYCTIVDTLQLARQMHPGQRNNLDALCKRYNVDNSKRDLHGALLDAEILAQVYLLMTQGQANLFVQETTQQNNEHAVIKTGKIIFERKPLKIIKATDEELKNHAAYLTLLETVSGSTCVWNKEADA